MPLGAVNKGMEENEGNAIGSWGSESTVIGWEV